MAGEAAGWTCDFPTPAGPPAWLKIVPQQTDSNFLGRAEFEIAPADGGSDLLITFFYQETEGGFLRVFWNAGGCSTLLCQNLYEGIGKGLTNQRTLRLPGSWIRSGGIFSLQASQTDLKLSRIKWEWLTAQTVPVSQALDTRIQAVDSNGKILTADDLTEEMVTDASDRWKDGIITAPVTQKVEQIGEAVQFAVELDAVPLRARLEVQLAGLPLNHSLWLWVNGKMAGRITPPVPDLSDAGYQDATDGGTLYDGWRKGSILILPALLQPGLNTLQFARVDDEETPDSLALKDLKLQLKYPVVP